MNQMNNKYKIIALFGKSGAGKDTVQRWAQVYYDLNGIVSCTTRPPRAGEEDGVDYYFLTNEEFTKKVLDMSMLEATCFRKWFYGTPIESLKENKINIGVFNIDGLKCLLEDPRLLVVPILISCDDKTRLLRVLERENNPDCQEICRRFLADEKDFSDIDFDYEILNNNNNKSKKFNQIKDLPMVLELLGKID